MSQPNARTVGLFVAGALAVVVVGLVAFGSRGYFEHRPKAVTYFHGSVAGLNPGAPVTFRGVRIGQVANISVQVNAGADVARIPVIMEFEPEQVAPTGGGKDPGFLGRMIGNRLGATLVMQSFITGQLAIELDYYPEGVAPPAAIDPLLPEIPEVRAGLNAMKDTISRLPLQELADNALSVLRSLNELVSAPEARDILKFAVETLRSTATTVANVESQAGMVAKNLNETAAASTKTVERLDALLLELQPKLLATLVSLEHLLSSTDQRTGQLTGDVHTLLAPRSPLIQDLQTLLRNLATASGAMRSFAEQVDRNPNALLMGKSHR